MPHRDDVGISTPQRPARATRPFGRNSKRASTQSTGASRVSRVRGLYGRGYLFDHSLELKLDLLGARKGGRLVPFSLLVEYKLAVEPDLEDPTCAACHSHVNIAAASLE